MLNIVEFFEELALKRPLFHSEADFQHAFAWELQQKIKNASIRLEYPIEINDNQIHLDIWTTIGIQAIAIELKYKTRELQTNTIGEKYSLKNQVAQPPGRYDFIKDIERLEQIINVQNNVIGYAILLTNDSAYWKPPSKKKPIDSDFRLHQRRLLQGTMAWQSGAALGTKKNREEPIKLNGIYTTKWKNYSKPAYGSYGEFKYLVIEIKNDYFTSDAG